MTRSWKANTMRTPLCRQVTHRFTCIWPLVYTAHAQGGVLPGQSDTIKKKKEKTLKDIGVKNNLTCYFLFVFLLIWFFLSSRWWKNNKLKKCLQSLKRRKAPDTLWCWRCCGEEGRPCLQRFNHTSRPHPFLSDFLQVEKDGPCTCCCHDAVCYIPVTMNLVLF